MQRPEIRNWWEQAKRDLITAKNCEKSKDYYASVFFCQQAVEKGLKALFILRKRKSPGTSHSLVYLAKETKVPEKFLKLLKNLTPEFVITRYPDVAGEVPHKLYDESIARDFIKQSQELMKWLKSKIER